jgi:hypothetical protein
MGNHTLTTFAGLTKAVNQLRAEQATTKVDKAILEKLLAPEQRSWGITYCTADPKGWEKFIGVAAKDQEDERQKQELVIAHNMGLTDEQFIAAKAKRAAKV